MIQGSYYVGPGGLICALDGKAWTLFDGTSEKKEPVERGVGGKVFSLMPDTKILRNGAASFTTDQNIANDWDGQDKTVIRATVPRTAALSVPAYGQNVHSEHEVVLAGTAWKGWDAWHQKAPDFSDVPLGKQAKKAA